MSTTLSQDHPIAFCVRCGRSLRAFSSVARGYGPTCAGHLRTAQETADLTDFHPWQADKAAELIESCGLVPTGLAEVYRSVSSDGTTVYLSTENGCTCKAGQHQVPCYHRAGVAILRRSRAARRSRRRFLRPTFTRFSVPVPEPSPARAGKSGSGSPWVHESET